MTLGEFRRRTQILSDRVDLILDIDLGNDNGICLNVDDVAYTTTKIFIRNEPPKDIPTIPLS